MKAKLFRRLIPLAAAGALLIAAAPAWAAHTETATLSADHAMTVAGTRLAPGHYVFKTALGANRVQVMENHKIIASVPAQWVTLPSKSPYTAIVSDHNRVQEIEFSGKSRAVKFGARAAAHAAG